MTKFEIRKYMKEKREHLSEKLIKLSSEKMAENIIESHILDDSIANVLLFAPYKNEPDMYIIHQVLEEKMPDIAYGYPRVRSDKKGMDFFRVDDISELEAGYMGILEPEADESKLIDIRCAVKQNQKNIIFFPGLCFDDKGNRIGYGGGFYDRFCDIYKDLSDKVIKAGICYDFQVIDSLENIREEHDVRMNIIITEKRGIYESE